MSLQKVYSITTNGSMIITGNTLGLSGARIGGGQVGSIRAFSTLDLTKVVSGYPPGTTLLWQENESQAILNIPPLATVKYARLQWGGTEIAAGAGNVTANINTSITFTTPLGSNTISPDPLTSDFYGFTTGGNFNQFYSRSQDVTSYVQAAGSGTYSVKGVPAVVAPDSNAVTSAGWSLAIIYELDTLPYRNMSVFAGLSGTNGSSSTDVNIYGFRAPSTGTIEARILVTAIEGDSGITGDEFLFGPDTSNLVQLSGPNNLNNNFFASQINNGDSQSPTVGVLNTTGTFGGLNSTPGSFPAQGLRQGWDITNVKSTNFTYGQNSATIRITTTGDAYAVPLIGLQIDSVKPVPFECGISGYRVWSPNTTANSSFDIVNLVTGESQTLSNNLDFNINAIGYNPQDNLIYGMIYGTNHLVSIDSQMVVINYGPISNLPVANYTLGAVNSNGYMFIRNSSTQTFYVIDVNQTSPNFGKLLDPVSGYALDTAPYGTNLTSNIVMEDWTFNAIDGNLYGYNSTDNTMSRVTPTGTVTNLTTTDLPAGNYSSIYSISDGFIYAINSATGTLYRITISGNNATGVVFSQTNIKNIEDGASCLNGVLELDFGDAPDTSSSNGPNDYSTLLENNGPRHVIVNNLRLGTLITAESDARQNSDATGDDLPANIQDDGFVVPNSCFVNSIKDDAFSLDVTYTNATGKDAYIYTWIDFNRNGVFEGQEAATVVIVPSNPTNPRTASINFVMPSDAIKTSGDNYIRIRITTDVLENENPLLTEEDTRSVGAANDGEVEDYLFPFVINRVFGFVWYDTNCNGIYENGENLASNVLVELFDTSNTILPTNFISTDSLGQYSFSLVPCSEYFVKVTLPNGYEFTIPNVGNDSSINSAVNPNTGKSINFLISESSPEKQVNAGLCKKYSISGKTFYDCNNNGIYDDSDATLPNVYVILLDSSDQQISSTMTNSDGYYSFENLKPGTYKVQFFSPAGLNFTQQNLTFYGSKPYSTNGIADVIITNGYITNIYAGFKGSITQQFKYCLEDNCCNSCNVCCKK